MSAQDRRERDPLRLQQILARLARIKVARAARQTQELHARWSDENIIETVYLRRQFAGGHGGNGKGRTDDG